MDKITHDTYMERLARFTRRRDEWQAKIDEVEAKLKPSVPVKIEEESVSPKKKSKKKGVEV